MFQNYFSITLLLSCWLFAQNDAFATNLRIAAVEWQDLRETGGGVHVQLELRWDNAWRNDRNHDAAWLFFKLTLPEGAGYRHLKVLNAGHEMAANLLPQGIAATLKPSADGAGLFVYPAAKHRGDVAWRLRIALDPAFTQDRELNLWHCRLEAFGVEMVQIPEGAFTLGDPDTTALRFGALYRSGGAGRPDGLFSITSEDQSVVVGEAAGQLCYRNPQPEYQGDLQGELPPAFPKGYRSFFIMKYELSQGEYAAFLNTLSDEQTQLRVNFGGRDYHDNRGTIYLAANRYQTEKQHRPCNYLSWNDACAFADWAGLRPMTELEFEKACRGTAAAVPNEYAWGTDSKTRLARHVNPDGDLAWSEGFEESQLTDANRDVFGASFYWVMDLSGGGVWERCVTIGSEKGRAFKGSHGDGRLGWYGDATNEDWAKGDPDGEGWGFRGGGFYYFNRSYSEFNPHSPVAYRRYGAWAGGNRSVAYGSRFTRTAD
ncbi:MAG TPA: SUMF1/EgtB/PvdO family nonheme iron enzyme [Saprospiraceae bacterium]|nr:SUMF1/EgtB/PvdO family nonheme iron enzyme [Saprospiraceae bacterium]HMQ83157.1 SUMF1/EgtB/PvdO family nonheme iron enzyme [Saprospiraceae bacterium]